MSDEFSTGLSLSESQVDKLIEENRRLRAALEVIANQTYPASYIGINEYGVAVYGKYEDAARYARSALEGLGFRNP